MPRPSTPALLLMVVRLFMPLRASARIRFSGIPHSPKPPNIMVAPSNTSWIASSAFATTLFIAREFYRKASNLGTQSARIHDSSQEKSYNRAMRCLGFAIVVLVVVPPALACSFEYDPASTPQFYRSEGWKLPGAAGTHGLSQPTSMGDAKAYLVTPDESPYIAEFPAQEFALNGSRQRMRGSLVKATIVRWEVAKRVVAYSYTMIPVMAHRKNGKWIVDAEAACIFWATFLDDRGDGIFRVLVPAPFAADLVPLWAKRKES